MPLHELAGHRAPADSLADIDAIRRAYHDRHPDPGTEAQRVAFGTSGHRGRSLDASFNEDHIRAITQAICDVRVKNGVDGPIVVGADTHALSDQAMQTALEVLAGNGVRAIVQHAREPIPTPLVSFAILERGRRDVATDGIVITPSHNPPEDGGFKYNPTHGGPAGSALTSSIETRANALLESDLAGVRSSDATDAIEFADLIGEYVAALDRAIDLEAIRAAGVRIGVDPLGGAGLPVWRRIAEVSGLDLTIVNDAIDPSFRFMHLDKDGRIRMDCSSPWAMAGLVAMKDDFDVALGNDPDADRHGIVVSSGLMNPNHYLAVAIDHLLRTREWSGGARVGKTLVTSSLVDRVVASHGRSVCEVPVGFKWFAEGLFDGSLCAGLEESAGASFLDRAGRAWSTDKDGILLGLLAAEIHAVAGRDAGTLHAELVARFGASTYGRRDAPADSESRATLKRLDPSAVTANALAGDPIRATLVRAPGNDAPIGGLKVATDHGWFAARPSGTEPIYKIYAESDRGEAHLARIFDEAQAIVDRALA